MKVRMSDRRAAFVVLVVAVALFFFGSDLARAEPTAEGHWEGAIELPGQALGVIIDLAQEEGRWSGTIDIPLQGAEDLLLTAISVQGDSVSFAIEGIPGEPTFRGVLAEIDGSETIAGKFSQGMATLDFELGREKTAALVRPQEPQPPFPYTVEEVSYEDGEIHFGATLTLPSGEGPFPAALLLTGSGPQNRDEELMGHKPFLVLADYLTRAGIAVLRADDRGVGGTTGQHSTCTISDFANDALAGVRYLAKRPEIDAQRIGLIGHSEGGITGPLAASRSEDAVAFVVMLAGTGVPMDEVSILQSELMGRARGRSEERLAAESAQLRKVMDLVQAGAGSDELREPVTALVDIQLADAPLGDDPEASKNMLIRRSLQQMTGPWYRHAVNYDPREVLRELHCPILAINGELDLQVDADQNLAEIGRVLGEAGNPDYEVHRLPGLNHLFQTATTGSVTEYAQIEETMSPTVLKLVGDWINERFGNK